MADAVDVLSAQGTIDEVVGMLNATYPSLLESQAVVEVPASMIVTSVVTTSAVDSMTMQGVISDAVLIPVGVVESLESITAISTAVLSAVKSAVAGSLSATGVVSETELTRIVALIANNLTSAATVATAVGTRIVPASVGNLSATGTITETSGIVVPAITEQLAVAEFTSSKPNATFST